MSRPRVRAPQGAIQAVVAPHAGIMFSGPVGACAYKAAARHAYDVAVLVGPSHFVAFDGVALYPDGAFASPFGPIAVDAAAAAAIAAAGDVIRALPSVHAREHSLEMQLPFLGRLFPGLPIVPLLMGRQSRRTIETLARALADGLGLAPGAARCQHRLVALLRRARPRASSMGKCATRSPPSIPSACSTCSSATPRTSVAAMSAAASARRSR